MHAFLTHSLTVKGGSAQLRSEPRIVMQNPHRLVCLWQRRPRRELLSECQVSFIPHLLMESHDGNEATLTNLKRSHHENQLEEGRRKVGKRVFGSLSHGDG